jgi:hypothetical protein
VIDFEPHAATEKANVPSSQTCSDSLIIDVYEAYGCTLYIVGPGTLNVDVTVSHIHWGWSLSATTGAVCNRVSGQANATLVCDIPKDSKGQVSLVVARSTGHGVQGITFRTVIDFEPHAATEKANVPSSQTCSDSLIIDVYEAYGCTLYVVGEGTFSATVTLSSNRWGWSVSGVSGMDCNRTSGDGGASISCAVPVDSKGQISIVVARTQGDGVAPITFTTAMSYAKA